MARHSDLELAEALDAIRNGDVHRLSVPVSHLEALGLVRSVDGETCLTTDGLEMLRMAERDGEAA